MEKSIFIEGVKIPDKDLEVLKEINKCLGQYGLYIFQHQTDFRGEKRTIVTISFDKEKYRKKNGRQAGARRRLVGEKINVADLEADIASSSPDDVAEKYGISRATLYRRIKEAKDTDNVVYI